jgi:hypothetical protein
MPKPEPSQINQLQVHELLCSKCGRATRLVGIEPAPQWGYDLHTYDLHTFECTACDGFEVVTIKRG